MKNIQNIFNCNTIRGLLLPLHVPLSLICIKIYIDKQQLSSVLKSTIELIGIKIELQLAIHFNMLFFF